MLARAQRVLEDWLTAPAPHAAGRMGLFRIVYCVFTLWQMSRYYAEDAALWPGIRHHVVGLFWLPPELPRIFYMTLESLVVASLMLLMIGYRTRTTTIVVLVAGTLLEAIFVQLDTRNSTVFLVFYIPLFMAIAGNWGDTYSLDARIQRERTRTSVAPSLDDGTYFMPARAVFALLALLFLSGSLLKMVDGGTWLSYPSIMPDLMLRAGVENALAGLPQNPLAAHVHQTPLLHPFLRYGVLAFEGLFWLSLLDPRLRTGFVALALGFHTVNAIWMNVTFTPILIVYLMLVDWEWLRWRSSVPAVRVPLPGALLVPIAIASSLAAAIVWHIQPGLRDVVSLGGLLTEVTLWIPAVPVVLLGLAGPRFR